MSPQSRDSRDNPTDRERQAGRRLARLLGIGTIVALAGVCLAAALVYVHVQLDAAAGAYTSFCNVNARVNCDRVLRSPFARLLGVPVAWLALAAYAGIAVLLQAAARAGGETARRCLDLACIAVAGAVSFSLYMAAVSILVLETVCLMCSGLYVVAVLLLWTVWRAPRDFTAAWPCSPPPLQGKGLAGAFVASSLAVAALAGATWPATASSSGCTLSVAELRERNPDFYQWYNELPVMDVQGAHGNALGDPEAPVTIVEFFDFECGYCRKNHERLSQLVESCPGDVRTVYRHFPLDAACNEAVPESIHRRACRAAEAAECAGLQGKFAEMADAMFVRQRQLFESNLFRIAEHIGIDMAEFERCMTEHETLPRILADAREGARLGIDSTPTLFINGRKVVGSIAEADGYEYAIVIEKGLAGAG